jgi:MerR family transcriptional regulator, thiopeptide resistance regulator
LIVLGGHTVKQVARLSGVSVRTLHHYDEIGLLKPDSVGANRYRYYGKDELLRLQQILFHRELGFPLEEIRQALDAPGFDRAAALKAHRAKLAAEMRRYRRLLRTIDETLAELEGARQMDDRDLYKGFAPEKQAEYEAWIAERHGAGTIEASKARMKDWTKADWQALAGDFDKLEGGMAKALMDGMPADSALVQGLMRGWADWIGRSWGRAPSGEAFAGLGRMYQSHPDFRARYEGRAAGLTDYLAEAMRVFGERELG